MRVKRRAREKKSLWKYWILTPVIVITVIMVLTNTYIRLIRIQNSELRQSLNQNDIVMSIRQNEINRNDLIVIAYGNELLIRRVIGLPGDIIVIDDNGDVAVNGSYLLEEYATNQNNSSDLTYPYQVPTDRYYVLSDNREIRTDSRSSTIGCISQKQIIGTAVMKIWPLTEIDYFK